MVRPGFPEPVGSRLGIVAEALLALAQRILGLLARDELTDLAADRRQCGELLFLPLARAATEELDDPESMVAKEDGKRNRSVKSRFHCGRSAEEPLVLRCIRDPDRRSALPDLPDSTLTWR